MTTKTIGLKALVFAALAAALALPLACSATENVPHAPFAQWADLPAHGQLQIGLFYQESEAYHFWTADEMYRVDHRQDGEHYGIDINQGHLYTQYGITPRWAADLALGYTTAGWRYFSNDGTPGESRSTSGLTDISFGVRYQIWKEDPSARDWKPTLTFRAGAVLPGSFDEDFPFAPGLRSAAIEPELLLRKHFGWDGFGFFGDGLFRWNRTTGNDQWIVAAGFFQKIRGWELSVGYRHLGTVSGDSIEFDEATQFVTYPRDVRENNDALEAGFSYTTKKRQIRFGFYTRTVLDGSNSDQKFWIGGYVDMPFTIYKPKGQ